MLYFGIFFKECTIRDYQRKLTFFIKKIIKTHILAQLDELCPSISKNNCFNFALFAPYTYFFIQINNHPKIKTFRLMTRSLVTS